MRQGGESRNYTQFSFNFSITKCIQNRIIKHKTAKRKGAVPSRELLKDNISKYLARIAISSHIKCCSKVKVGDVHVLSISCHSWWRHQGMNQNRKKENKNYLVISFLGGSEAFQSKYTIQWDKHTIFSIPQ